MAGARGLVGSVFLSILTDAGLPAGRVRAFGTEAGSVLFGSSEIPVRILDEAAASELDVLFLATDGAVSRELVEGPARAVPLIVDNSSAYRLDPAVPLVVPEVNAADSGRIRGPPGGEPQLHHGRGGHGPRPHP